MNPLRFHPVLMLVAATLLVALAAVTGTGRAQEPQPASPCHVETWAGGRRALEARFTDTAIELLEKLNRCDRKCLERYKGPLVVAEAAAADELAFSPFPSHWPAAEPLAKALVVDQPMQAFAAYEHGEQIRWGPVSTGRSKSPTPPGLYHLNWRSPGRYSTVNPEWFMRWYFNIDNRRGLSMHAYALPGYPASHACVRLLERDARWLFEWGEGWQLDASRAQIRTLGTPVLVRGRYAFGQPPAWQTSEGLAHRIDLPPLITPSSH